MSRFIVALLVSAFVVVGPVRAAPDEPEPPVRLKKKERPATQPVTPEKKPTGQPLPEKKPAAKEPKPAEEPAPPAGDEETAAIVSRLSKNIQKAAGKLSEKDPSEPTRQIQRTIIQDLDALINQEPREPPPQASSNDPQSASSKRDQKAAQRRQSKARSERRASAPRPSPAEQQQSRENIGGQAPQRGDGELNKIADLYKDIWGHLPEAMRLEMDQYAREQFMMKYNDLLKQYYATIAEKGRKKGE